VHVRVCWDVATAFARVINRNSLYVCGAATAQWTGNQGQPGGGTPITDCIVEDNFASTTDTPQVYTFNPGDYPNEGGAVDFTKGDALAKNNTDIVVLFDGHTTDPVVPAPSPAPLDLTNINFKAPTTVSGPTNPAVNGNVVPLPRVTPVDNKGPESANAHGIGYVVQSLDATGKVRPYNPALYPTHKFLISYQLPDDAHLKVGGKNFVYTASLHVTDSDNAGATPPTRCGNADWTFTHDGKNLTTSTCGENSFFGFAPEPASNQVTAGVSTLKAFYVDESPLRSTDSAAWPGNTGFPATPNYGIIFTYQVLNNPDVPPTQIPQAANPLNPGVGAYSLTNSDSAHSKDKYNTTINWKVPDLGNGNWEIYLKAYDTDNNKAGNDCGIMTWTIALTGNGIGDIRLVE
jgi:hypothetical protein